MCVSRSIVSEHQNNLLITMIGDVMKKYDVIIIGSGPSGIITGVTVRNQYPEKNVLMLAQEEKGLVPCGIPYIFHELNSVEKNQMNAAPFVKAGGELKIDEAVDVNADEKTVKTASGELYYFDKLVFATGSVPVEGKFISGYDLDNVFYIRKSYSYIENLFNKLKDKKTS
jgi:NADH oxidase (H2O2-forming)